MPEHDVAFSVPERELGKQNLRFIVSQDGKRFGELLVSKGALVWRPTYGKKTYKLSWDRFNRLVEDNVAKGSGR